MRHRSLGGLVIAYMGIAACGHPEPSATAPAPTRAAAADTAPRTAPDVADLTGARASSGESEMVRRGYTVARQDGLTAYWWSQPDRSCVRTVTSDGRYRTVQPVAASGCGQ